MLDTRISSEKQCGHSTAKPTVTVASLFNSQTTPLIFTSKISKDGCWKVPTILLANAQLLNMIFASQKPFLVTDGIIAAISQVEQRIPKAANLQSQQPVLA